MDSIYKIITSSDDVFKEHILMVDSSRLRRQPFYMCMQVNCVSFFICLICSGRVIRFKIMVAK